MLFSFPVFSTYLKAIHLQTLLPVVQVSFQLRQTRLECYYICLLRGISSGESLQVHESSVGPRCLWDQRSAFPFTPGPSPHSLLPSNTCFSDSIPSSFLVYFLNCLLSFRAFSSENEVRERTIFVENLQV